MMLSDDVIPTILLEEHNEAFLAWNLAAQRGVISAQGNCLLHVDEHADLQAPRFRRPIADVIDDPERLSDFTYSEVAINEFIVAAIHQGMFTEFCWVRQGFKIRGEQQLFVYSERNEGRKLIMSAELPSGEVRCQPFLFVSQSTRQDVSSSGSIVLDIDLDFFSSDQAEHRIDTLEVTPEQFEQYQTDKYHFLRLDWGSRVTAVRENGRCYFRFRQWDDVDYACQSKVTPEAIRARLELFSRMLQRCNIRPRLITIARSRISGYTPDDQSQFIETLLLERLSRHYALRLVPTEQICEPWGDQN